MSLQAQTTHTSSTADKELFAAQSGKTLCVTDITVSNTSASDTEVIVKDGTTEIYRLPAPANNGASHKFNQALFGTAGAAINLVTADSVASVRCSARGYAR